MSAPAIQLLGAHADDEALEAWIEENAGKADEHMRALVGKMLSSGLWHFSGSKKSWDPDDLQRFYNNGLAYLSLCKSVMHTDPRLCLFDVDWSTREPLLSDQSLAEGLVQCSMRKYCVLMSELRKKYGKGRVSTKSVRDFLTETELGRKALFAADLIAVPNNGRDMIGEPPKRVPHRKFYIIDRSQLWRFRKSPFHRGKITEHTRKGALVDECQDLDVAMLRLLDHDVDHLDPAHNYGERDRLYECDVLLNMMLTPTPINMHPLFKDMYNTIKQGSLGPFHFLLRAYQLALKGKPDSPAKFVAYVDEFMGGLGDPADAVRNISSTCFVAYADGKWSARKCDVIKKKLTSCLTGVRIGDSAQKKDMRVTRITAYLNKMDSVSETMTKDMVQSLPVMDTGSSSSDAPTMPAEPVHEDMDTGSSSSDAPMTPPGSPPSALQPSDDETEGPPVESAEAAGKRPANAGAAGPEAKKQKKKPAHEFSAWFLEEYEQDNEKDAHGNVVHFQPLKDIVEAVSYTHLRAHETR